MTAPDQQANSHVDRADQPYALERSRTPKLVATSATMAGMISAAPTPSRKDQPINSTVRFGAIAVVNNPMP